MSKATVNMTNWQLYVYNERYNLSGIADKHPTLGNDIYVSHTSSLVDFSFENEILTYETKNTIYVCPLKYMELHPYKTVVEEYKVELTHRADNSDSILDKLIAASAKLALEIEDDFVEHIKELAELGQKEMERAKNLDNERRYEIIKEYENSIYIEISNIASGDKLTYHIGESFGTIAPCVHTGTFQDSILYMLYNQEDANGCSLDFRYFPKGWNDTIMETYSWSDNIKQAVIKNMMPVAIEFNGESIAPGELRIFTPESGKAFQD